MPVHLYRMSPPFSQQAGPVGLQNLGPSPAEPHPGKIVGHDLPNSQARATRTSPPAKNPKA
eukprot:4949460-Prorocentrum_lima.AAC.1